MAISTQRLLIYICILAAIHQRDDVIYLSG